MKILWLVPALLLMATPVAAEDAVTLAELQGREIEGKIVFDRVVRKDGRQFPVRVQHVYKLEFHPGDVVSHELVPTITGRRGSRQAMTSGGTFKLGEPRKVRSRGGGQAMYIFSDGTLTFVRTFRKGAFIRKVAFAHADDGTLTCIISASHAREDGTGTIELNNAVDGKPITIQSYKQVSSVCDVKTKH